MPAHPFRNRLNAAALTVLTAIACVACGAQDRGPGAGDSNPGASIDPAADGALTEP